MICAKDFITPRHSYHGQVNPENLVFNANVQEFSSRVSYISCLATAGKLSTTESYQQIKDLWAELDRTQQLLGVGKNPFNSADLN